MDNVLGDPQIRTALKKQVLQRCFQGNNYLVIDEMNVGGGIARVDIATISSLLHGYEIKSDVDTLVRLPDQISAYNTVFDRITLVVGYSHAYDALQLIPCWWGVKLVELGPKGGVRISTARLASKNPLQCPLSLANLLYKEEAIKLLTDLGMDAGIHNKPKYKIIEKIAMEIDVNYLRLTVCNTLRQRQPSYLPAD